MIQAKLKGLPLQTQPARAPAARDRPHECLEAQSRSRQTGSLTGPQGAYTEGSSPDKLAVAPVGKGSNSHKDYAEVDSDAATMPQEGVVGVARQGRVLGSTWK
jgi:hypothetical protein